ncbi:MAG: GNAT family N-acetyltransferase [Actinobacteria bacterium]|nr:GNAT family N-acetyltransferase [Actinomycetota bacterium]
MAGTSIDTIRPATTADLPAIDGVLARAFADDPVWQWALTKRPIEPAAAKVLGMFARAHFGGGMVSVATDPRGEVAGAALWTPPGHWKIPYSAYVRYLPRLVGGLGVRGLKRVLAMEAVEKLHPHDEHYYLAVIGIDPDAQGGGGGRRLITPVLERADSEGLPCYLESSKEANVPYYRSFGFEVVNDLLLPGGPPMWLMRREAR